MIHIELKNQSHHIIPLLIFAQTFILVAIWGMGSTVELCVTFLRVFLCILAQSVQWTSFTCNTTTTHQISCPHFKLTLGCPGSQGAAVIDEVVEGEGQDEEGAVTGRVHLERHIPLVQTNRLPLLGQGSLE